MNKSNIFENAKTVFADAAYKHPMYNAMTGGGAGEAEKASEARFNSIERGQMVKRVIGQDAMIRAGLEAGQVKIDAKPVTTPPDYPATEAVITSVPELAPDHSGQLMLPEVGTPDHSAEQKTA